MRCAYGGCDMTVAVQGYIWQILDTRKNLGTHVNKKVAKCAKNNPAGSCHISVVLGATKVSNVPFLRF